MKDTDIEIIEQMNIDELKWYCKLLLEYRDMCDILSDKQNTIEDVLFSLVNHMRCENQCKNKLHVIATDINKLKDEYFHKYILQDDKVPVCEENKQ